MVSFFFFVSIVSLFFLILPLSFHIINIISVIIIDSFWMIFNKWLLIWSLLKSTHIWGKCEPWCLSRNTGTHSKWIRLIAGRLNILIIASYRTTFFLQLLVLVLISINLFNFRTFVVVGGLLLIGKFISINLIQMLNDLVWVHFSIVNWYSNLHFLINVIAYRLSSLLLHLFIGEF